LSLSIAIRAAAVAAALQCAGTAQSQSIIVVTGSREPRPAERLAADLVVIDSATLRGSNADSLADLLRREAGVQLSRTGGPGQPSNVLIRGAGASQNVVLVDGVRVGSTTLGFASLETLPLAQIERVEVLRGPGSALYGADAVGGVVQVFTRRGEGPLRIDAQAAVGGYGGWQGSLAAAGTNGPWDGSLSLSYEGNEGVSALRPGDAFGNYNPDHDGYRLASGQLRLGFKPAPGHRIGLTWLRSENEAQYDASEYPPPSFAPDPTPDFRNRTRTEVGSLEWQGRFGASTNALVRAARSTDDARAGANVVDTARSTRDQAVAQLGVGAGAAGRLVGALEAGEDRARSSSLAQEASRRTRAAALSLVGDAGAWSWQAEARHDDVSDFDPQSTWRLGGAWAPVPGWTLRALAGTTFRAPTFNDLYYPGYGVPGIEAEHGRSVEAGVVWRAGGTELSAVAFRNEVRNLIGYQADRSQCPPDPAYDYGCAGNVARALLRGATLAATHQFGELGLKASLDLLDAKDADTGQPLPRRAERQARLAARWARAGWTLQAELGYLGERPDGGKQLASETTLDLGARWQLTSEWQLFAKLVNATDTDLEPARDYQGLGRQAWIGVRYGAAQ
jgi:vitamin B12 transporter